MGSWTPDWEMVEDGQCDFPGVGDGVTTLVTLQRCRTEDGNWLYLAVATGTRADEGGVALAVEHIGPIGDAIRRLRKVGQPTEVTHWLFSKGIACDPEVDPDAVERTTNIALTTPGEDPPGFGRVTCPTCLVALRVWRVAQGVKD